MPHGEAIGRVCPYAAQQCGLERGCLTFDADVFGVDVIEMEARARDCTAAGAHLYADELRFGAFHPDEHNDAARKATSARRRRELWKILVERNAQGDKDLLVRRVAPAAATSDDDGGGL